MVTLFSRITDLENHTAHEILTDSDDYAAYRNRVGIAKLICARTLALSGLPRAIGLRKRLQLLIRSAS